MEALESNLKTTCFQAPHWQQLVLQAFWFGVLSWAVPLVEEGQHLQAQPMTVKDLVHHADPEFVSWPYEWLEATLKAFEAIPWTTDSINAFFDRLETIFQDCLPTDLHIYHILVKGDYLTDEQWSRLFDTVAFQPPQAAAQPPKKAKTRRMHGRRGITPMKRRRGLTRHTGHLQIVKLQ